MFCSNCGKEITESVSFCPECGNPLTQSTPLTPNNTSNLNNAPSAWFYLHDGERKGPVDEKLINDLIITGVIDRNTKLWKNGLSGWVRAEETQFNTILQNTIPTTPMGELSDKFLWCIAIVPLCICALLEPFCWNGQIPESAQTFFVSAFYYFFIFLDYKILKKGGIPFSTGMCIGAVLLPPIYLFLRAKKTTKNYMPLVVWITLLIAFAIIFP